MPILTASETTLLLIASGGLSLLVLIGFALQAALSARWRRSSSADTQRLFEQLDLALHELRSQAELLERLDARTKVHESGGNNIKAFDVAVRMARTGASSDQLAANSGLTKQEARLLARLHGADKARA